LPDALQLRLLAPLAESEFLLFGDDNSIDETAVVVQGVLRAGARGADLVPLPSEERREDAEEAVSEGAAVEDGAEWYADGAEWFTEDAEQLIFSGSDAGRSNGSIPSRL